VEPAVRGGEGPLMSAAEIDEYLAQLDEPKRSTLEHLRRSILAVVPNAEQGISYRCPAFRVGGRVIAGFAAFTNHLSYLPHSGSTLAELGDELTGYSMTRSALHFGVDTPLPDELVARLVTARLREAGLTEAS